MGATVTNTEITDFLTALPVNWARANVGDKIRIVHDFRIEEVAVASDDNPMEVNTNNGFVGNGWIFDPTGQFSKFNIGDDVVFGDYVTLIDHGTFTVIGKQGNTAIQLNATFPAASWPHAIFSIANPITALKYRWNFIENQEQLNFFSKIDGTEQLQVLTNADASDPTPKQMTFLGGLDYRVGNNGTIEGGVIFDSWQYFSTFRITYDTFITPLMLAEQLNDISNAIPPTYFANQSCFKYVYQIDALYNYSDPNRVISITESSIQGNTGWYNENFNTGITNYSIDDVNIVKQNITIPALQLTQITQYVTIIIKNTTDSPFVSGQTPFVLNFAKAPIDASEYQGKNRIMRDNFVHDRAQSKIGLGAVHGELSVNPNMTVLKHVVGQYVSPSEMKVFFRVEFGPDALSIINESSNPTYMFWVTIADHTKTGATYDKVSLLVNPKEYNIVATDPTMIGFANVFLRHFESNPMTEGVAIPNLFPGDEVAPYGEMYIDRNGRENDVIVLKSITTKVKAKNAVTLDEVLLESITKDVSGTPVISGHQYFNLVDLRPFHIPSTEVLSSIVMRRNSTLDAAGKYYYDIIYPFICRWEYWKLNVPNNSAFFDTSLPANYQNGWNMFWYRYSTVADWGLYYEVRVLATKNGELQGYTFEFPMEASDFNSNPDWTDESIEAYDPDSPFTLLSNGSQKFLMGYKNNRIEARFKFNGISAPVLGDCEMFFRIYGKEGVGRDESRTFSSKWIRLNNWFESIDTSDKVVLSTAGPGLIIVGEALLDGTQLTANITEWSMHARLFDKRLPVGGICGINNLRTENGMCLTMEDGSAFEVE